MATLDLLFSKAMGLTEVFVFKATSVAFLSFLESHLKAEVPEQANYFQKIKRPPCRCFRPC